MTLAFNPLGLGGRLAPADAASFQAASIAQAVLAEDVPEDVRNNFERARKLHLHGVLEYEFFTAAFDYALLVLEGALRARFLTYYDDGIPLLLRGGIEELLQAKTFDDIRDVRGAKLREADGALHRLPLGADDLLEWARRERLLVGTRSRRVDRDLSWLRNHAAHPVGHTVCMPPDSARMLCNVAETINRLWGHDSPGGRLFPAPVTRQVKVAAIAPKGSVQEPRLDQVCEATEREREWRYVVVLAAEDEPVIGVRAHAAGLVHRPGFQTTEFPCEQLWEGDWNALMAEIDRGAFAGVEDTVPHLDRLFFIRARKDRPEDARSPADLLALQAAPKGLWYAVIADSPIDAWVHVRDHEPHIANGRDVCPECFAQIKARRAAGSDMMALARTISDGPLKLPGTTTACGGRNAGSWSGEAPN